VAISSKLLNDGEHIVVSTRTHAKALIVPLLVLVLSLAVGVFLSSLIGDAGGGIPRLVIWVLLAVVVVWYVVRPFLSWLSATYTITNRRLITRSGIVTRRGHDIPLTRISDVAYERDLLDRLLGCGTLLVSDASTNGQVRLHDIPRAEAVHRQVSQLLHDIHTGDHDGT